MHGTNWGKTDLIDFLILPTMLLQFNYILGEWKSSQSNKMALHSIPSVDRFFYSLFYVFFSWKNCWENSKMVGRIYC